ncbi:MAG TPA: amidohydrolase [Thermoanaerobaculia bacterium]|nr:amidohydrolase [Thermoanaerobaculia bacterium]
MTLARRWAPLALCLLSAPAMAAPPATDAWIDQTRSRWVGVAQRIWETPELALEEKKSSAALAAELEKEGFRVTWGIGGEATAFAATAGTGKPVVALLAEYDALPGLSQAAGKPKKEALVENAPGHGCGHNLLGTAAVAAAIAANRARIEQKLPGTIQLFGTPAEEQLYGKAFMVRDGAFRDTDVVLSWHPDDQNRVTNRTRLAATAVDVEFFGRAAHAAASPWLGRSSLDALVLFDHAMSLMREHIKPTARIHRMVSKGGAAANIIPDYAKGQYWLRDATGESVTEMLGRMRKAAEGAALATETRAQVTQLFSVREPVPNDALDRVVQKELERVGPPAFDAADVEFAKTMQKELNFEPAGLATAVMPYREKNGGTASSDIAEVSAIAPLAELNVAARPLGTAAHHWAETACAAHPIGYKGMIVAAKVLASSAVDLLADPALVKAARDDFLKETKGKPYVSPLSPDAKPRPY